MGQTPGQYNPAVIEPKWQAYWEQHKSFHIGNPGDAGFDPSRSKYYVLDMFPYTSGSGLHVGHPEGYTATDILSRYKRMKGFNVLHPIGWDSFGLPAEQHAVQTNVHPRVTTESAIRTFKAQLKRFGFSYDWDRELATTDLKYYKWTQWIFLQLFNSWFDDAAEGRDEKGRPYHGKARPIAELIAELEEGLIRPQVPDFGLQRPEARSQKSEAWSSLSEAQRRAVIDHHRLAYMDEVPVNWCPMLGTVLANEEVTNEGRSERGDYPVYRKPLKQWMLRITRYCERLIADIDTVDWPEPIKAMQRNWVGKSTGAEVAFPLASKFKMENGKWKTQKQGGWTEVDGSAVFNSPFSIRVFTTRPDTLFGATYMVLAPEHPLVDQITTVEQRPAVSAYVEKARNKTDLERTADSKEKTGVFTGAYAINPVSGEQIPIWVADYVLMGYGTGAIMAVPAHDLRDWEFARKFLLHIRPVVQPPTGYQPSSEETRLSYEDGGHRVYPFTGDGTAINSGQFSNLPTSDFKSAITRFLEQNGLGRAKVNYKLRDWLFSRQRYWGEPFPILHGPDGELVALDESELPLDLPHMDDFKPHAGEDPDAPPRPPLRRAGDWVRVQRGRKTYTRELNTMPQWAGSCWYYLRYLDSNNDRRPWGREVERYWMNVDQYVGGAEHAVLHLLYARFWHKVLYDLGQVSTIEPFQRLFNQGLILSFAYKDKRGVTLGTDQVEEREEGKFFSKASGEPVEQIVAKMSKALKNVVNPDEILDQFGADAFRLYEMYMGPLEASKPWNTRDIPGLYRFLGRVWRLVIDEASGEESLAVRDVQPDANTLRLLHKMIKKVGEDIEAFKFNTAIAEMIAFTNYMTAQPVRPRKVLEQFILALSPFAPHLCEELWQRLGHGETLAYEQWPTYDPAKTSASADFVAIGHIEVPVQVNGKIKTRIKVVDDQDEAIWELVLADQKVLQAIAGKQLQRKLIVRDPTSQAPKLVSVVSE